MYYATGTYDIIHAIMDTPMDMAQVWLVQKVISDIQKWSALPWIGCLHLINIHPTCGM